MLGGKVNMLQQIPFDKSPAALEQTARDLIQTLGYTERPVDRAYGFVYDVDFQRARRARGTASHLSRAVGERPAVADLFLGISRARDTSR